MSRFLKVTAASIVLSFSVPLASAQQADIPYGSQPHQLLDWYPAKAAGSNSPSGRWALYLHGNGGSKADVGFKAFGQQLELLLWNGFTVFAANWTPVTIGLYPAQLDDGVVITQFIRANAGEFHIDPDEMMLWGISSGSTIGGWLCFGEDHKKSTGTKQDKQSTRPKIFTNWGGLTNFLLMSPQFSGSGFGVPTLSQLSPEFLATVSGSKLIDNVTRSYTPPVASYYGNISDPAPYVNPHDIALMQDLHAHLAQEEPAAAALSLQMTNPNHPHIDLSQIERLTDWSLARMGDVHPVNLARSKGVAGAVPSLVASGTFAPGSAYELEFEAAANQTTLAWVMIGAERKDQSFMGGTLVTKPLLVVPLPINNTGKRRLEGLIPTTVTAGSVLYMQFWHEMNGVLLASNGLRIRFGGDI